jgi:hypothetical protein
VVTPALNIVTFLQIGDKHSLEVHKLYDDLNI